MKTERLDPHAAAPEAIKTMLNVERYLSSCSLEHSLIELVKMRASQINGCAFCLNMHSRDARKAGETEQRLYLLNAWHEASCYTDRERAALAWTEALTLLTQGHVPDEVYEEARGQLGERELTDLTLLVGQINNWNRFAIGFRYQHD